jgi:predicted Ser/Thr protein kinase
MDTIKVCIGCGAKVALDAPQGLCPQCLLKAGLETQAAGSNPGTNLGAFVPPLPAELAPHFPQLEILEQLGQGGMGVVYKARQPGLDRIVALKILSAEAGRDPSFAQRFAQEARALARLNHPNIVAVHDFGRAGGYYYFLMEFIDGVNLREVLRSHKMSQREALAIVPKICEALQFAHDEGIVHRDIKPENILVDKKGRVKMADFGLAKLLNRAPAEYRLTATQTIMGTPHYMSPEQLEKPLEVDHRSDIFSLGVVFYEMLTGDLPLGRFAPPSQKVQLDVRLDEVVLRTLENDPSRRYQHASELKTEVENISGLFEKLPSHVRRMFGYDYRSSTTLFGLPLLHIALGVDPATGKRRTAKGILAIGDAARGVFAFGGTAMRVFAFGGLAFGVVAFGGLGLGLLGIGGVALGLIGGYGGVVVAPVALGGLAIGYYAMGGAAWVVHALGGNARDPAARDFYRAFNGVWPLVTMLSLLFVSMMISNVVPWYLKRREASKDRQP